MTKFYAIHDETAIQGIGTTAEEALRDYAGNAHYPLRQAEDIYAAWEEWCEREGWTAFQPEECTEALYRQCEAGEPWTWDRNKDGILCTREEAA